MTPQIKAFSLFNKRLNKMRDVTKKDATALTTYPQNNTALTELSTLAHIYTQTAI